MGQKVNPTSFRLGILYKPSSRWFASKKEYQDFVLTDIKLEKFIYQRLHLAGIVEVIVERSINTIHVTIHAARPGVVIGRGGSNLEVLKPAARPPALRHRPIECLVHHSSPRLVRSYPIVDRAPGERELGHAWPPEQPHRRPFDPRRRPPRAPHHAPIRERQ